MYVVCFINVKNNYKNNLWKTLYLKLSTFIFVLGNPVNSTVYGECQAHDRLVSDIAVDCLSLCVIRLFVALPILDLLAASKNEAGLKTGQNWLKNNHLATKI